MEKQCYNLSWLARIYGLQTTYRDAGGQHRQASQQAVLAALRALGAPVSGPGDVPEALRQGLLAKWRKCCEPVTVAWKDRACHIELCLPKSHCDKTVDCRLELEDGSTREWKCDLALLSPVKGATVEGIDYQIKQLPLPGKLPPGYHQCIITMPGLCCRTLLVSAPRHAYLPPGEASKRIWGVFLPLYALRSEHSWAAGDFGDLERLLHWTRSLGGGTVGTLPLLAAFLDNPFSPSPYSPASRLFWNEFYLNITTIPELELCRKARDLLDSPAYRDEIATLRRTPLVDYRRGMAVKRRILELLARCCAETPAREAALQSWVSKHPAAGDYARFRAAMEKQRAEWQSWPERMRNGKLAPADYKHETEHYHMYVQWLAHEQLTALSGRARHRGEGLYLDLPLGVHRAGYDVWRESGAFARGAACGAPPDPLNTSGQNWEFPPLHPEGIRQQGYRYYIACLRNHMRHAGILRLDHVMGLHRLFWIPAGMTARDGMYVKYRAEEFYAILALESHRHRTLLVGEDLGTVPPAVRAAMGRHNIYRMHILPFEMHNVPRRGLHLPPSRSLAALNTHDMPPFATYWRRENRHKRMALARFLFRKGWLTSPITNDRAVLTACLEHLAASLAGVMLVNLEDLWLETAPQNIPGTTSEYPNWQRKAGQDLETFTRLPQVLKTLQKINRLRRRKYHTIR